MAVIAALADAMNRPGTEIEPLSNWTDPGAIDTLFENTPESVDSPIISFEYGNCRVTVSRESVQIEPQQDDGRN